VDVFEPGPGDQLHDLNPSTFPPTGLFWTLAIPAEGVHVRLAQGRATMEATDVPIFDYRTGVNAIFGGGPEPIPGVVSFTVVWSGINERLRIQNYDPVYGGFAGHFIRNTAQMAWTATVGDWTFASAPLATSTSSFAEIGQERNGLFFRA